MDRAHKHLRKGGYCGSDFCCHQTWFKHWGSWTAVLPVPFCFASVDPVNSAFPGMKMNEIVHMVLDKMLCNAVWKQLAKWWHYSSRWKLTTTNGRTFWPAVTELGWHIHLHLLFKTAQSDFFFLFFFLICHFHLFSKHRLGHFECHLLYFFTTILFFVTCLNVVSAAHLVLLPS